MGKRDVSATKKLAEANVINSIIKEKAVVSELEKEIEELKAKNVLLQDELDNYKVATTLSNVSDVVVMKKILNYYAKGYMYKVIYDKMIYIGFDGTIEDIETICKNVEDLDSELVLYYKKQKKAYVEEIKINPDVLKDSLVSMYLELINSASMDLEQVKEVEERRKIREEIKNHGREVNALIKNIQDGDNVSQQSDILSKMASKLSNTLSDEKNTFEVVHSDDMLVM